MTTTIAKRPANVMRTYTKQVRDHAAAMQRLQDQYLLTLKRAETQYFEGVKKITDNITHDTAPAMPEQGAEEIPIVESPAN
jgi:hypothetical protein